MLNFIFGDKRTSWRDSPAHLLLLSRFLEPRLADHYDKDERWANVLGEPVQTALRRLRAEAILVEPGLHQIIDFKFKVPELKAMLKLRGAKVSGRKDELIARLIEVDVGAAQKAVAGLRLLQCSKLGAEYAAQYVSECREKQGQAEQQTLQAIEAGKFREAVQLFCSYQSQQVFPLDNRLGALLPGKLREWWKQRDPTDEANFLPLFFRGRPRVMKELSAEVIKPLQSAAAMRYLWQVTLPVAAEKWLPAW